MYFLGMNRYTLFDSACIRNELLKQYCDVAITDRDTAVKIDIKYRDSKNSMFFEVESATAEFNKFRKNKRSKVDLTDVISLVKNELPALKNTNSVPVAVLPVLNSEYEIALVFLRDDRECIPFKNSNKCLVVLTINFRDGMNPEVLYDYTETIPIEVDTEFFNKVAGYLLRKSTHGKVKYSYVLNIYKLHYDHIGDKYLLKGVHSVVNAGKVNTEIRTYTDKQVWLKYDPFSGASVLLLPIDDLFDWYLAFSSHDDFTEPYRLNFVQSISPSIVSSVSSDAFAYISGSFTLQVLDTRKWKVIKKKKIYPGEIYEGRDTVLCNEFACFLVNKYEYGIQTLNTFGACVVGNGKGGTVLALCGDKYEPFFFY